ncbi:hypothetical protein G6F42_024377 [Rhizopus arrhizus]|nr:hypothetical protein G6F42_024377 [Rhizopus arrhizus]
MHAQGSDPTLIAYDELKTYKQGDKPMKLFGLEITSLLQRAGIYQPTVILRGAKTLVEGIKITTTEIERSLSRTKKIISMGRPIQYQPEPAATAEGSDFFRFGKVSKNKNKGRRCFKCGKIGHIKKDCWSKKEHKQNNQEMQDYGVSKVQDSGLSQLQGSGDSWGEEEDEVDIFAHIMNNNQEIKHEEVKSTTGNRCFKMQVTEVTDGYRQDVLVDNSGSTISSISRAAVKKLGLQQEFAYQEQITRYGNTPTTQVAASN